MQEEVWLNQWLEHWMFWAILIHDAIEVPKTVSSILMGPYNHFLSLDATIMIAAQSLINTYRATLQKSNH